MQPAGFAHGGPDDAEVRTVVESVVDGRVDPGEWAVEQILRPVVSGTAGIWRVRSGARSFVVKVVQHSDDGHPNWLTGDAPGHWYYWKREVPAYESGLLESFAGPLRGVRCFASVHRVDGTVALWLEDLAGDPAPAWPLARYGAAARDLGHAQGAYVVGGHLPAEPWLSRGWLRSYLAQRTADLALLGVRELWQRRVVRDAFPDPPVAALQALHEDQELFLAVLDRLPRTLCHFDVHPKNLFGTASGTVIVDWGFVGHGALGEDAGNLVPDTVLDFHQPPDAIGPLYDAVLDGYVTGLGAAGWTGDPTLVRLAFAALAAAKYAWI